MRAQGELPTRGSPLKEMERTRRSTDRLSCTIATGSEGSRLLLTICHPTKVANLGLGRITVPIQSSGQSTMRDWSLASIM